jgi:UDP-N-acetylmuramate dehydrogenase
MKLADLTTFGVGGEIDEFIEVETAVDFVKAVVSADKRGKKLLVLGGGSNLLPRDQYFDGVVIKCRGGAGETLASVCARQQIPYLAGIPGSLGGAVVQNAGAYGKEIADYFLGAKVFDRKTAEVVQLDASDMAYAYRDSALKRSIGFLGGYSPRWIVLEAKLKTDDAAEFAVHYPALVAELGVSKGNAVSYDVLRSAILKIRRAKGVLDPNEVEVGDPNRKSAGSFFKNPVVDLAAIESGEIRLPHDAPRYATPKAGVVKISAAWLIQNSGINRQYSQGAAISSKHALVLVNPSADYCDTAGQSLRELMDLIIMRVKEIYNIVLEPEPIIM